MASDARDTIQCTHCGGEIKATTKICTHCTRPVDTLLAEPGTAPTPALTPSGSSTSRVAVPRLWHWIIPLVLCLGLIGGYAWHVTHRGGPTPGMVLVPGGTFMMGCNRALDPRHTPCFGSARDEEPYRTVTLSPFEIDRTEVSQREYQLCIEAGVCVPPRSARFQPNGRADYPVDGITWEQANQYCAWAKKRLPTEAEWEMAARGTDGRVYPWGNDAPGCNRLAMTVPGCPGAGLRPVGSFPRGASVYGALDMEGNVSEWVADWYTRDYYARAPSNDPTGPTPGSHRVMRGASAGAYSVDAAVVSLRVPAAPDDARRTYELVGVRCARSAAWATQRSH